MERPYEYEEKDEMGKPVHNEGFNAANRIADVDHYIANLDDPEVAFTASVVQRLAVTTSLLEAMANGLDFVIPRLRDSHYGVPEDDMLVVMLGDCRKEFTKTEELMGLWETAYGQEN